MHVGSSHSGIHIEICANSAESALAAQEGGADRVELCENLLEGGTTPSAGSLAAARRMLRIGLHVMIRPRGGDFCYSPLEREIMIQDIRFAKNEGADGVVFGALTPGGDVDVSLCKDLVEEARPMKVTFHRAFDMARDPFRALAQLIDLGVDLLLTSGQRNKAVEGAPLLARLVEAAGDRLRIMVGSGVNESNICDLIRTTGARDYHLSGRTLVESPMTYRNPDLSMGGCAEVDEYQRWVTDAETVRRVVQEAKHTGRIAEGGYQS